MIPEVLKREIQHRLERMGGGSLPDRLNAHPVLIFGMAGSCLILLIVTLVWALRPASSLPRSHNKTAWFCDMNTGKLFQGSAKKAGPIATPSGPSAGFRAHVYSYKLDPNESELFVGFLERPDPDAKRKYSTAGENDFGKWVQGHLIRRLKDKQWVQADSPEGQAILKELTQPDKRGRTPIYQPTDRKRSGRI
jgi:hypothetical protein